MNMHYRRALKRIAEAWLDGDITDEDREMAEQDIGEAMYEDMMEDDDDGGY